MKAKEKITLLMKGISMKDITSLEEQEAREAAEEQANKTPAEEQSNKTPAEPEVDYKKLYEDLLNSKKDDEPSEPKADYKKLYEEEAAKVTQLQQQNINKNLKNDEKERSIDEIMISAYSHS